jgi:parvulin-like peptidyl-prolyl isomerase
MMKRMMVAGLGLLMAAVLTSSSPLRAEILEQVLVKVNGDILTKLEFEQRQVAALQRRPEFANGMPNNLEGQRAMEKAIGEMTPDLILDAIEELLLIQRARELNYVLSDEQYKGILDNIKKSNNLTDEAQFQAALKQEGITEAELRRNLERSMMVSQVRNNEVMQKVSVTDEEARAYYEAHATEFTTPAEMTLREILIEVPTSERGVNAAQQDDAKAKAEEIRQRILKGEPFARLAAEVSASPSKANGGLIGPLKSDELAPQLRQLLEKLKVGEVAEVIATTRGFQILKLESRTETRVQTFEQARGAVSERIGEPKSRVALAKYLDGLREQASITWRNDELKRAYDIALERRRQQLAESTTTAAP